MQPCKTWFLVLCPSRLKESSAEVQQSCWSTLTSGGRNIYIYRNNDKSFDQELRKGRFTKILFFQSSLGFYKFDEVEAEIQKLLTE